MCIDRHTLCNYQLSVWNPFIHLIMWRQPALVAMIGEVWGYPNCGLATNLAAASTNIRVFHRALASFPRDPATSLRNADRQEVPGRESSFSSGVPADCASIVPSWRSKGSSEVFLFFFQWLFCGYLVSSTVFTWSLLFGWIYLFPMLFTLVILLLLKMFGSNWRELL